MVYTNRGKNLDLFNLNLTKLNKNMKIAIAKDVLIQDLGGESVLLNLNSEQYFGLDDVGTRMWSILTEVGELEAAQERLSLEYDVEPEVLRQDLQELIEKLIEHGLVEVTEA